VEGGTLLLVADESGIIGDGTGDNLYKAFVGEAKAHIRLLAFARKADEEGYAQIARLFRAIAAAEEVHAANHLRLLGENVIRTTEENLAYSFETEKTINEVTYPLFISEAEREGEQAAVLSFSAVRDVEEGHARLYKKAMDHLLQEHMSEYYVCGTCGYTSDGVLPDQCPICGAESDAFRRID
jgi:rubrerythrin